MKRQVGQGNRRRWGIVLGSILLAALQFGCSEKNEQFCSEAEPCGAGFVCQGNECIEDIDGGSNTDQPDALALCEGASECVALAPQGWIGPTVFSEKGQLDTAPPECPESYSQFPDRIRGADLLVEGSCRCECGNAEALSCSNAGIRSWDEPDSGVLTCSSNCMFGQPNCLTATIPQNDCALATGFGNNPDLKVVLGQVESSTCASGTLTDELIPAEFEQIVNLCSVEPQVANCESGKVCAPEMPSDFVGARCIYQEGEHECPAGDYQFGKIFFEELEDTRACPDCECEVPVGTRCGSVHMSLSSTNCAPTGDEFGQGCFSMPDLKPVDYRPYYEVTPQDHACEAVTEEVEGEVTSNGATTLCCDQDIFAVEKKGEKKED